MLPADAAGGEEEPVHEDAGAVVVRVVGQQTVPLKYKSIISIYSSLSVTCWSHPPTTPRPRRPRRFLDACFRLLYETRLDLKITTAKAKQKATDN